MCCLSTLLFYDGHLDISCVKVNTYFTQIRINEQLSLDRHGISQVGYFESTRIKCSDICNIHDIPSNCSESSSRTNRSLWWLQIRCKDWYSALRKSCYRASSLNVTIFQNRHYTIVLCSGIELMHCYLL